MAIKKTVFIFYVILLLFVACQKKEVQLPLIDIPGISEIQNHSSIWVFMESQNGKLVADLNKNNKLINTHWIYNIDKRLRMKEVVPILVAMQENKNKDSMHKKEGMKSYFSYADTKSSSISLILFPQTNYITETPATDFMNELKEKTCLTVIELLEDDIIINRDNHTFASMVSLIKTGQQCPDGETRSVMLICDEYTTYQTYLQVKVYLKANDINCESVEYFHTVK